MGFIAPLEMRAMDSDSESNRSKKSGSSVLMQMPGHRQFSPSAPAVGSLPPVPPSYANHMMLSQGQGHGNGDTNHNQNYGGPSHGSSGNQNEFFVDVM